MTGELTGPNFPGASLQGKACLVTGAASGIGKATAALIAQRGAQVLCFDMNSDALDRSVAGLRSNGLQATGFVGDASVARDCLDAVTRASTLGEFGILINAAGAMTSNDTVEQLTEENWDRVLAANLKSVFLMSKFSIPIMRANGGGVIVSTASVHAFASMPGTASYAASKGAIVSLTRQMAVDLVADGIRVVAVAPGSVDTPMTHKSAAAAGTTLEQLGFKRNGRSLSRVGDPSEVAEAIVWLASPQASFVNGTTVIVDGGLLSKLI